MSLFGKRSLGTKFLLSLTIGALVMTFLGALATFHITSQQLQSQLVQRGKLLASAINHSAMIATSEAQFAHVAGEVMRDNPEVTGVVILSQDGKRTIFEKYLDPQSVSRETSEQLKAEARHALSTGTFGFRPSDSNQLKIVVPLTTPLGSHIDRGMRAESTADNAHGNAAKAAEGTHETGHMKSGDDHVASTMPQHEQMIMPGSASDTPAEPKSDFTALSSY